MAFFIRPATHFSDLTFCVETGLAPKMIYPACIHSMRGFPLRHIEQFLEKCDVILLTNREVIVICDRCWLRRIIEQAYIQQYFLWSWRYRGEQAILKCCIVCTFKYLDRIVFIFFNLWISSIMAESRQHFYKINCVRVLIIAPFFEPVCHHIHFY